MEIQVSESAGVRYLHFGSNWVQGAMRVARPWALELDYTRAMMTALLLRPAADWPRSVLLIGLGAASLTKFLHRHRPDAKLTVVEIEPAVVAVARQNFKLPEEDERLRIVIGDGAEFVAASQQSFDLILVDGFDADARTGMLDTLPFYLNCKARLSSSGLMVTNLLSKRRGVRDALARINEAFADRAIALPSCDSGNVIAFAASGALTHCLIGELKTAARRLKEETGLNLQATISCLEQSKHCPAGKLHI
ncbi:MAG: fused MFS/spermidine synthase [Rhodocyclaceae bacterium]|nr:fused MFS/spermidine synthase [Rhodocyclaceae bacterium]MDP1956968.1 fused MFS/spermidine synthase [Rhodocyclaceae bacterium]